MHILQGNQTVIRVLINHFFFSNLWLCCRAVISFKYASETQAEPSLQATQMKLKRARLADDLNEKIALRPGPMELVEKNILPVESSMKETSSGKRCSL